MTTSGRPLDQHDVAHPPWCDPRVCEPRGANTIHAGTPVTYPLRVSDAVVSLGLVKAHDTPGCGPEDTHAVIAIEDTTMHLTADCWAEANDLRILAALLLSVADQLDRAPR